MSELLTAAQMRRIEQSAMESGSVTGLELMERAGRGVVAAALEAWPELAADGVVEGGSAPHPAGPESPRRILNEKKHAVILCGPGNNGGDGFVIARLLCARGWRVVVFFYGDPARLPPDARRNHDRCVGLVELRAWSEQAIREHPQADLYVDAVFGAGLTRAPTPEIMAPLDDLYVSGKTFGRMVCVDAPTGLCMDSGRALSAEFGAVHGFLTVTFHRKRVGHVLAQGPEYCGALRLVDIGLDEVSPDAVSLVEGAEGGELQKVGTAHKYSHGHALILSGGPGKTGAARLAARGALRIGAGLVTLGVPPSAQMEVAAQLTAVMIHKIADAGQLEQLLHDDRLRALCLGPGLGVDRARALVPVALAAGRPTVLDADALSAYADAPEVLLGQVHDGCVLTPHGGEFSRLFPDISEKLRGMPAAGPAYSKVDAVRDAAARAGCVVLLKGADTVIASPEGHCAINAACYEQCVPWLATAGSGDVLAGFVAGLLARGLDPMAAAKSATWLHVECGRDFGPGLIAEDLPERLPAVFRGLGL